MRNKLKFLIKHSLSKKIGTKWFKIVNVLLCILIIAMANIDRLITIFGGDFNESTKVYVKDNTGYYNIFKDTFEDYAKNLKDIGKYEIIKVDNNIEKLKEEIIEKDDVIIVLNKSQTNFLSSEIYTYEVIDTISLQMFTSALNIVKSNIVLTESGLTLEQISSITSSADITTITTNEDVDANAEAKDIISTGLILIFIIPFFIFIVLLTQMIGAEINDEKSTKSMEIIISNVPPKYHFISKIISSSLFVLIQALLVFVYAIIALFSRSLIGSIIGSGAVSTDVSIFIKETYDLIKASGVIELLIQGLPFIILLFVLNILAYAILAGVLASMTTNIEDYQQLQTPIMIIMMIGYYVAIMASVFDGSLFIKIVSYIPILSALVAPVIYMLGQTTLLELIISNLVCLIVVCIIYTYGLRIYKVGILNYSSTDLWKKVFKSLKEK